MTQQPIITVRRLHPKYGESTLVYTGRIHRDFGSRFRISADRVLDEILAHGMAVTHNYLFTLRSES